MTEREQIEAWVRGQSLHEDDPWRCVPDYSCCRPALLAPLEERELFLELYQAADPRVEWMYYRYVARLLGKTRRPR